MGQVKVPMAQSGNNKSNPDLSRSEAKALLTEVLTKAKDDYVASRSRAGVDDKGNSEVGNREKMSTPNARSTGKNEKSLSSHKLETVPRKQPFGANKNIHTLDCIRGESSKELKKLGGCGKIFGFKN